MGKQKCVVDDSRTPEDVIKLHTHLAESVTIQFYNKSDLKKSTETYLKKKSH